MWIVSILIAQLAGFVGSFFTVSSVNSWYLTINKPSFNPPSFVFGPVWITLYTLMGIASYLIFKEKANGLVAVYLVHLVFNSFWSIVFFGWQRPDLAFGVIVVLLSLIVYLTIKFYAVKPLASYLMIPYLLWVSFASVLNFSIWRLNL